MRISLWWRSLDKIIFTSILIMIVISSVSVIIASPTIATRIGINESYFVYRQLIYLFFGMCAMFLISFLDTSQIKKLALIGIISSFLLLIYTKIFGLDVNGAKRWMSLGGFSIQPSEFLKPFLFIIVANIFSSNELKTAFKYSLLPYLLSISLILSQPDVGTAGLISCVYGIQVFIGGISLYLISILVIAAIFGAFASYYFLDHVRVRIETFFHGDLSENYQVNKSLEAINHGGFFGTGPAEGTVKKVLPDSHTDFIFAAIGEEFGAIMCIFIIILFAVIVYKSMKLASKESDKFKTIVISGLASLIGLQAIINISVTMGVIPPKGMTLPIISYGGSSVCSTAIIFGVILALTRGSRIEKYKVKILYPSYPA